MNVECAGAQRAISSPRFRARGGRRRLADLRSRGAVVSMLGALAMVVAGCADRPDTPLTVAAAAGHKEEVARLIAAGADVDAADGSGLTPLIRAVREGRTATARTLLRHGADPDLPAGSNDWAPLVHAVHKRNNACVLALLEAGADPRGPAGRRALLMAAGYGNPEAVRALLDRGADPRAPSIRSVLLTDAVGGAWDIDYAWPGCAAHTEAVKALLEAAPDLRLEDDFWGRRALAFAARKGCTELVDLVERLPGRAVLSTGG